jgi:hypothetical protein
MKENIFNITKKALVIVALAQLGLSQIHIAIITKVFAPEIGFYLFLFVLFGCLVAFNNASVKQTSNMALYALACLSTLISGGFYLKTLFSDINSGNLLTFSDAQGSIYLTIATLVVYSVGTIIVVATKEKGNSKNGTE